MLRSHSLGLVRPVMSWQAELGCAKFGMSKSTFLSPFTALGPLSHVKIIRKLRFYSSLFSSCSLFKPKLLAHGFVLIWALVGLLDGGSFFRFFPFVGYWPPPPVDVRKFEGLFLI